MFNRLFNRNPSAKLIDEAGNVTIDFEKALAEEGLAVEYLVEATRKQLPQIVSESMEIGAGRGNVERAAQDAAKAVVKRQLAAGAKDSSLAPIMLKGGRVVDDDLANEALKQGFDKGLVQSVKVANDSTREGMLEALNKAWRIKGQSSLAAKFKPSDVVGRSIMKRFNFIRDKAADQREVVDRIANQEFSRQPFDLNVVSNNIAETFKKLRIDAELKNGVPVPNFRGSAIQGDNSSKRAIVKMIELLKDAKGSTAFDAHLMKRSLDNLINFERDVKGLGKEGQNALKSMRAALNNELRTYSAEYARANDILSNVLSITDELQKPLGKRVNILAEGAESGLGNQARAVFSKRQDAPQVYQTLQDLDAFANDLGGQFDDDFLAVSSFVRDIEDVFGKTAKTSFGGEVEGGIKSAVRGLARGDALGATGEVLKQATKKKVQNDITDANAFISLKKLLKRGEQ